MDSGPLDSLDRGPGPTAGHDRELARRSQHRELADLHNRRREYLWRPRHRVCGTGRQQDRLWFVARLVGCAVVDENIAGDGPKQFEIGGAFGEQRTPAIFGAGGKRVAQGCPAGGDIALPVGELIVDVVARVVRIAADYLDGPHELLGGIVEQRLRGVELSVTNDLEAFLGGGARTSCFVG